MTDAIGTRHVSHNPLILALAWGAVGLPLLWGVTQTLYKAAQLFH
jgi:hypothetical protein